MKVEARTANTITAWMDAINAFMRRRYRLFLWSAVIVVLIWEIYPPGFALYDFRDEDYPKYRQLIREYTPDGEIDFGAVNGGDWEYLCLYGGYTNPSTDFQHYRRIGLANYFALRLKSFPLFRLAEVEENETLIAYLDTDGNFEVIHFDIAPDYYNADFSTEYLKECVKREAPVMKLG